MWSEARERAGTRAAVGVATVSTLLVGIGCSEGTDTGLESVGPDAATREAGGGGSSGSTGAASIAGDRVGITSAIPVLPLRVRERHLEDFAGQIVVLRGVNQHGFLDVPDGAWDAPGEPLYSGMGQWRPEVIRAALEQYRQLGFNVVRFHTVVEWWKTNPQSYSDPYRDVTYPKPYRELMNDVVQWAGERGVYVIFDFFAMQNVDGVQSGQESLPWPPWGRYPEVLADRAEFVSLWASVAQVLGHHDNVLFELYNEPHGDAEAEAEWFQFAEEVLPAIRTHTDNPVIVQWDYMCWVNLDYPPPQYSASTLDWIERHPLDDSNVVFSTHLYRNSGAGGPGSVHRSQGGLQNLWAQDDIEQGLILAGFPRVLGEWERPLIVTELGAFLRNGGEDREHEIEWLSNTLSVLNCWNVGYVGWAWRSDEQLDHGMLHEGTPNDAGQALLDALPAP